MYHHVQKLVHDEVEDVEVEGARRAPLVDDRVDRRRDGERKGVDPRCDSGPFLWQRVVPLENAPGVHPASGQEHDLGVDNGRTGNDDPNRRSLEPSEGESLVYKQ